MQDPTYIVATVNTVADSDAAAEEEARALLLTLAELTAAIDRARRVLAALVAVHTRTRDPWLVRAAAHGLQFYLRRDNTWGTALDLAGLWSQEEAATHLEHWAESDPVIHVQTARLSTVISEMKASNAG